MPNETTYRCPECGEEIDHLKYTCNVTSWGTEWGTADFEGSTIDTDDTEYNDGETSEYEYQCPECDAEIGTPDCWEPAEELAERQAAIARAAQTAPRDMENRPTGDLVDNCTRYKEIRIFVCPHCRYSRPLDEEEAKAVICDKCQTEVALGPETTEIY